MGSSVNAVCPCGLESKWILVGPGFNGPELNYFPCLCEACHSVVQINLCAKTRRCPKCKSRRVIPYDNPRLSESKGAQFTEENRFHGKEFEGNLLCPSCNKMTLKFEDAGMLWD